MLVPVVFQQTKTGAVLTKCETGTPLGWLHLSKFGDGEYRVDDPVDLDLEREDRTDGAPMDMPPSSSRKPARKPAKGKGRRARGG